MHSTFNGGLILVLGILDDICVAAWHAQGLSTGTLRNLLFVLLGCIRDGLFSKLHASLSGSESSQAGALLENLALMSQILSCSQKIKKEDGDT